MNKFKNVKTTRVNSKPMSKVFFSFSAETVRNCIFIKWGEKRIESTTVTLFTITDRLFCAET